MRVWTVFKHGSIGSLAEFCGHTNEPGGYEDFYVDCLTLKVGPIGCPEISVNNYQHMPCNQGWIQVLWGLKLLQFLGPTL